MQNKGFTLMEVIIYVALFSIIIGGLAVSVFQISKGGEKAGTKVTIGEEINFVLKKIDWALTGAETINNPISGTDTELSINKTDFPGNPIVIRLNSEENIVEYCTLSCDDDENYSPLTTRNVTVEALTFEYIPRLGELPEGIKTTLTINGITNSSIKYQR